jgi:protein tyrosine phosphatase
MRQRRQSLSGEGEFVMLVFLFCTFNFSYKFYDSMNHYCSFFRSQEEGRTGIFIVVDTLLKQMKAKGEINLPAYLRHVRAVKPDLRLITGRAQYVFIHDVLAEAVAAGETNVHSSYLTRYINSLQSSYTTDEHSVPWQLLDRQFKLSVGYQPAETDFTAALNPANQSKNQSFDFLPVDHSRVMISTESGDYVNASWLLGFHGRREFIVTQHPLDCTILDLWQMVWEHKIRTIVVLSTIQPPVNSFNYTNFTNKI